MRYKIFIKNGKADFEKEIPNGAILIAMTDTYIVALHTTISINNVKLNKNNKNDKEGIR